jgi:hypothetical protein
MTKNDSMHLSAWPPAPNRMLFRFSTMVQNVPKTAALTHLTGAVSHDYKQKGLIKYKVKRVAPAHKEKNVDFKFK